MNETAIVALAAAVAAGVFSLIGTMVGEFLSYRFRRRERSEVRIDERRRAAVQMLHERIDWARYLIAAVFHLEVLREYGVEVESGFWERLSANLRQGGPWRGQFIDDEALRKLAMSLRDESGSLFVNLNVARLGGVATFKSDPTLVVRIEGLIDEIEARLVHLNW